jgi:adenine-specific DNA-methyltransferase
VPVLQFKGKTAVEQYHRLVPHHVLDVDGRLSLAKEPSLGGNLIIEGDNLLALKALMPTHAGKVKCIYIDPPYNTGNEGWIYNDNLQQPQFKEWIGREVGKEGEDACRHDKWCCMMFPRLQLLHSLLSDDGVIFVSIDDNELHNLLHMLDEIFGPECRIACLVWRARNFPDARPTSGVSTDHEYIVAYGRTAGARLAGRRRAEGKYTNPDKDPRGPWMSCSLLGKATKEQRPNLHYALTDPETRIVYPDPPKGWICHPDTMQAKIKEKRVLWPKKANGRPREKVFLRELKSGRFGYPSVIDGIFTSDGTEEIRRLFGAPVFQFPKPSLLIAELIEQVAGHGDIVLDSFAGSGTTGHAVLRVNSEEEGSRRFILVQQPYETKAQCAVAGFRLRRSPTTVRNSEGMGWRFATPSRMGGTGEGCSCQSGTCPPPWPMELPCLRCTPGYMSRLARWRSRFGQEKEPLVWPDSSRGPQATGSRSRSR